MTTIFLSYARADATRVTALEQTLREQGVETWRDQESLYGGQQWPKAIGDNIASHDFFLLAWSHSAASSHFVEFEWNTAVALRKPVIPCLLDDTPLPAALQGVQGINVSAPDVSARLSAAFRAELPPAPPPEHISQVLGRLEGIGTTAPDQVASHAKAVYTQQGWSVQGGVYQAQGDIHLTIHQAEPKQGQSKLETWTKRVGLITAVLGIMISLVTLQDKIKEKFFPGSVTTPLRGVVIDAKGQPLSEATVTLQEVPDESQTTTSDGGFVFEKVPGKPGDRVRVFVKKRNFTDRNEYVPLPGPARITINEVPK